MGAGYGMSTMTTDWTPEAQKDQEHLREGVCGCIMYTLYSCMNVYAVCAVCAYGGRVTVRG